MARTTAPLFSLDASGTVAKAVVFSKWRGRQYVRRHAIPKNPMTAAQLGIRAAMKFLSQHYTPLKDTIDAEFALVAANANVSIFNAFVAANMKRWRMGKAPSDYLVPTEAACSVTITQALTPGPRNVLITVTASASTAMSAIAIFRDTDTITAVNWNNCIAIIPVTDNAAHKYTDAPLAPGDYHYRSAAITNQGAFGTACTDASATVPVG
jgi:hypothetical protein